MYWIAITQTFGSWVWYSLILVRGGETWWKWKKSLEPCYHISLCVMYTHENYIYNIQGVIGKFPNLMKNNLCLNLLNFGCHLLQNIHLVNVNTNPIMFSTSQKHSWSHSLENCQRLPVIFIECWTQLQNVILSVSFSILK